LCQHEEVSKTAYLRVYSPTATGSADPVPGFVREFGILSEPPGSLDRAVEWNGRTVVCPSNLRLRVLEPTVAFAKAFGGMGAGLIPEDAARLAVRELRRYHSAHPLHRSHVLTSPWHVPVRWFALFSPSNREIYDGPDGPRVRFRTSLEDAKHRIGRAVRILESVGMFRGPVEEMGQLAEWLAPFADGSMVELDYDEVSEMFDPGDVVLDDTCELIEESLAALEEGDMVRAGECYGRVIARWAPAFSVTFSN
jgi:hypothetical protein